MDFIVHNNFLDYLSTIKTKQIGNFISKHLYFKKHQSEKNNKQKICLKSTT